MPHGYASFKHICNVIIGYVNGMNKSMLDLYKKLESQEIKKREKCTQNEFLVFPFSNFFLFLSSLSFMSIFFFPHTREEAAVVSFLYVCFPKTRNLSSLLTTLQEAILLKFSNIFVKAKLHAMVNFTFSFFETLIQELVTHCHYYLVREFHVLQSLLQNCTCPHRQGGATGCQQSMAASFRMKRPTHC